MALSPDSQTLAYGLLAGGRPIPLLQLIDLSMLNRPGGKPQPRGTLPTPYKQSIRALAFSADSKILASTGDNSPAVHVWDIKANPPRQRVTLEDGKTTIRSLAFSLEGSQLATGSTDGMVRVYDLSKPQPPKPRLLQETIHPIAALAFVPGGQKLIVSAHDRTLRLWNLVATAGRKESVLFQGGLAFPVTCVSAAGNPANPLVITGSQDTTVRRWNVVPLAPMQALGWLGEPVGAGSAVVFLADDRTVAACHEGDRSVRLWQPLGTNKFAALPTASANLLLSATFDGRALAMCGYFDGRVQLRRQGESGAFTADDHPPLPRPVTCLAFSPGGKSVATGNLDGLVQVANVAGTKPWKWRTLTGHRGTVRAVAFSPDRQVPGLGGHRWDRASLGPEQ